MKLSNQERASHDAHVAALVESRESLNTAISDYNESVREASEILAEAVSAYNDVASEARAFVEDIASDRRDKYDERSDAWKESERGEAAAAFVEAWESWGIEDAECDQPSDVDEISDDACDDLTNLPVTPEDA